ncbi:hypothetical protein [Flavobacterium sp. HSC-61S13]|uniref:hypothetical protein n=1 Tax=Flavobacterium sp. HSC-61S13 TaxID=2910963 RepID=UPI0020A1F19C|nr:hypothetical protein [Flavobacterium sp. HSC-61S13]MCP1996655.1 hypothetical protein [Flavobacterium sp. HSC-61S13]
MAFQLNENNLNGLSVITDTNNELRRTPENFTSLLNYSSQFQPGLMKELVYENGKGSILGLIKAVSKGKSEPYQNDYIQYAVTNRLHNLLKDVVVVGNEFTSTADHKLRPRDVIRITDGDKVFQAIVSSVISDKKFIALNDGLEPFTEGNVDVMADFSSRFRKGDTPFEVGKKWDPKMRMNYTHVHKDFFKVSDSDLANSTWIETPAGPKWVNFEMERFYTSFDNQWELTLVLHERAHDNSDSAKANFDQGMFGLAQQVKMHGNIAEDYIRSTKDLSNLAKRAKQQGTCREFTYYVDHDQMALFREMMSGVNSSFLNGSNYGAFNNDKDMALNLDFVSVKIDGVQFHFTSWSVLDDPTLLGAAKFKSSELKYLGIPSGVTHITENGNAITRPYLDILYRQNDLVNRNKQTKFWGVLGQQSKDDTSSVELITEGTNRAIALNNYFIGY